MCMSVDYVACKWRCAPFVMLILNNVDIKLIWFYFKWPYFSTAWGYTVIRSGMLVVLYVLRMRIWPWPDPRSRSRSLTFSISANCTFYVYLLRNFRVKLKTDGWLRQYGTYSTATRSQISEFLPQLAVTWLQSSRNDDITRFHWVLSPRCLRLEGCDCDCR